MIIGVIAALVVGLLLGYGWGRQMSGAADISMTDEQPTTAATNTTATNKLLGSQGEQTTGTVAQGNAVAVLNQAAGTSVMLKSVTLTEEGWVAIRDASGRTLGAALFSAGTHADVTVPLLRPTEAGQNYQALIYFDDGSKTFSLKTETIVLNPDGSVAGGSFNTN
ncbi:MAG: hypothetical protein P4L81_06910 [Candidatus Pacebacteria bacterium]|nr:hypothetical protein [Candidatus Paceibacterota bacterium]